MAEARAVGRGRARTERKARGRAMALAAVKGVGWSSLISVGLVLLFAVAVKLFGIPDEYIEPINQILKAISVILGTLLGTRGAEGQTFIKGAVIGGGYMCVGLAASMLVASRLYPVTVIAADIAIGAVTGAASGMLLSAARIKRSGKRG